MITLETLREALFSQDPYEATDRLVRAELDAGRKTQQVFSEINAMLHEARRTPGLSEDGEEALFGILDALTGNCRSDQCYQDPPNDTLPTEEEIGKLPRWARVAIAARCARRVSPLLSGMSQKQLDTYSPRVLMAIEVAERAASGQKFNVKKVIQDVEVLNGSVANFEQSSVISAAKAAVYSALDDFKRATLAVSYAGSAYQGQNLVDSIRRDFDHLASLSKWNHWTDDTPVPPEVFGPLWPEGPPKGWPPITDIPERNGISLAFFARERPTPQMIEDDVVNLFDAINRYYISRGGVPLTYEDLRSLLPALVPEEV